MYETVGTLNLKIARLEQHIRVLHQQRNLGSVYPDFYTNLTNKYNQLQAQLLQLAQSRDYLLCNNGARNNERITN